MENPEHKIKIAIKEKDARTVFEGKNEMWNRLESALNKRKGVAAFWRVAAVFFGLLLAAGVFAGVNFRAKMHQEKLVLTAENAQLQLTIDSLLTRPDTIHTETLVVEKIVYRDRLVQPVGNESSHESQWKQKYQQLEDSAEAVLSGHLKRYKSDLLQLQAELDTVKADFIAYKSSVENPNLQHGNDRFRLKSEHVELGVQKSPSAKNPEMELKVFPANFQENKNNLNKSIFKK